MKSLLTPISRSYGNVRYRTPAIRRVVCLRAARYKRCVQLEWLTTEVQGRLAGHGGMQGHEERLLALYPPSAGEA